MKSFIVSIFLLGGLIQSSVFAHSDQEEGAATSVPTSFWHGTFQVNRKMDDPPELAAIADKIKIHVRYQYTRGIPLLTRKYFKSILISTQKTDEIEGALKEMGFKQTERFEVTISLTRTSDINGYGTGVNGEVHRYDIMKLNLASNDTQKVNEILEGVSKVPFHLFYKYQPQRFAVVASTERAVSLERGFQLRAIVSINTFWGGDVELATDVYNSTVESPYLVSGGTGKAFFSPDDIEKCSIDLSKLK